MWDSKAAEGYSLELGDHVMPFRCHAAGLVVVIFLVSKPVSPDGRSVKTVALEVDSGTRFYRSPAIHLYPTLCLSLRVLDQDLQTPAFGLPPAFVNSFIGIATPIHLQRLMAELLIYN